MTSKPELDVEWIAGLKRLPPRILGGRVGGMKIGGWRRWLDSQQILEVTKQEHSGS